MQDENSNQNHGDPQEEVVNGEVVDNSDQEIDENHAQPTSKFEVLPVPHHHEPHLMGHLKGGLQPLSILQLDGNEPCNFSTHM